jgi:hypothetical protein
MAALTGDVGGRSHLLIAVSDDQFGQNSLFFSDQILKLSRSQVRK